MSQTKNGQCLCNAVTLEIVGEPEFTIRCYCKDCQHISGGGHLPQIMMTRENVAITGPIKTHQWKSDSGNDIVHGFCGNCGSSIYKTTTMMSNKISIIAGSFCDSSDFSFDNPVHQENRQPWDKS